MTCTTDSPWGHLLTRAMSGTGTFCIAPPPRGPDPDPLQEVARGPDLLWPRDAVYRRAHDVRPLVLLLMCLLLLLTIMMTTIVIITIITIITIC